MNSPSIDALIKAATDSYNAGDFASAKAFCDAIHALFPDQPRALLISGLLDYRAGSFEQAIGTFEKCTRIQPNFAPAVEMLGVAYLKVRKLARAVECFQILADGAAATSSTNYYRLGHALFELNRILEAEVAIRKSLRISPKHGNALYLLANILRVQKNYPEAEDFYKRTLDIQPNNSNALDEYGGILADLGRTAEAESVIRRAIAMAPERANPYTNLGRLFQTNACRASEALSLHDLAIVRKPNYADAHNNRGVALFTLGRYDEASSSFQRALSLKPGLAEAHTNLGHLLLMKGDLKEGWREYAWRWQCSTTHPAARNFSQPLWQGEDLCSGSLLVWGEQGLGDEILYGSMVGDLVKRGISVLWEVDPRLVSLAHRSFPEVQVIGRTTPPHPSTTGPGIRAQSSSIELGKHLRQNRDAFPHQSKYLRADLRQAESFRLRLLGLSNKHRLIGVSWGSASSDFSSLKTSPLKAWAPIWRAAGNDAQFVNLQYGDTVTEQASSGLDIVHLSDLDVFNDIDGLAALISACDVVISVSNTTAHLAGALGVTSYVMVPSGSARLWYWGDGETGTLWYPSVTVLKQAVPNNWDGVISQVARALEETQW